MSPKRDQRWSTGEACAVERIISRRAVPDTRSSAIAAAALQAAIKDGARSVCAHPPALPSKAGYAANAPRGRSVSLLMIDAG